MLRRIFSVVLAGIFAWAPTSHAALKAVSLGATASLTTPSISQGTGTICWPASFVGLMQAGSCVFSDDTQSTNSSINIATNAKYANPNWQYTLTGAVPVDYVQFQGQHIFRTAPSGTSGNTLTWNTDGQIDHTNGIQGNQFSPLAGAKILVRGNGTNATQLATTQTTVPTCTANCGTSPSVAGSDTAGIVTMGATGVPASAWVLTFNGTWATAPSCIVQSALASMVVGKMPIAVVTSTTTITVTTNGTAPSTSDKYQYICMGVS